ncbi:hypothetical protein NL676_013998 [Syzygium grande]|nr:hypothetical protein NL676_013998 [Syzygium grande]
MVSASSPTLPPLALLGSNVDEFLSEGTAFAARYDSIQDLPRNRLFISRDVSLSIDAPCPTDGSDGGGGGERSAMEEIPEVRRERWNPSRGSPSLSSANLP